MPENNTKKAPAKKAPAKKTTASKKPVVKEEEIKVEEEIKKEEPIQETEPIVEENKETPTEETVEETAEETAEVKEEQVAEVKDSSAPAQSYANTVVNPVPLFRTRIENFDAISEAKRVPFYKDFFKIKLVSYILMGVCLAFVVALFIVVFTLRDSSLNWIIYVILILCVLCLIGNMVYSRITVKKSETKFKNYVYSFLHDIQEACYQDTKLKDATIDVTGKVDNEKIYFAHIYSTINRIESRSVVKGSIFNHDLTSADVAITIPPTDGLVKPGKGKASEVFAVYGRAFEYDYKLAEGQGIIVVRKAENTIMPNHTIGYKEVSIPNFNEDIVVYATDDNLAYGFFTAELIERINAIKPNENLFDFIISFNDKGTFIYTNYNDNYMVVPTSKAHPDGTYAKVIDDTCKFVSIFELLK